MEATVTICGKDVRFVSSAATPLNYRATFGKDLLRDLRTVSDEMESGEWKDSGLSLSALTVYIGMAYVMAKDGDPSIAAVSPSEWLEGYPPMFMYDVLPVIQALWAGNMERLEEAKKKAGRLTEILQQPYFCSGRCSSECHCETSI